jgi:hypothetical protein
MDPPSGASGAAGSSIGRGLRRTGRLPVAVHARGFGEACREAEAAVEAAGPRHGHEADAGVVARRAIDGVGSRRVRTAGRIGPGQPVGARRAAAQPPKFYTCDAIGGNARRLYGRGAPAASVPPVTVPAAADPGGARP